MHFARLKIAAAACLLAGTFTATAATRPTDAEISALAAKYSAAAVADRQDIHKNAELSNRETRTGALVAEHLKKLGIEVKTGIAHTGVVGILKGGLPGKTIAVRADMDGLPVTEESDFPFKSTVRSNYLGKDVGVSHACGHDVHTAALLGTASVLASLRDRLPGTVMFIFQPAEEGVPAGENGGAKMMVEEGIFSTIKPDAVIAFHTNGDPPDEEGDDEKLGKVGYRARTHVCGSHALAGDGQGTPGARRSSAPRRRPDRHRLRDRHGAADDPLARAVPAVRERHHGRDLPQRRAAQHHPGVGRARRHDPDLRRRGALNDRVAHARHLRRGHEGAARDIRAVFRPQPSDDGQQPGADGPAGADARTPGGRGQHPGGPGDRPVPRTSPTSQTSSPGSISIWASCPRARLRLAITRQASTRPTNPCRSRSA